MPCASGFVLPKTRRADRIVSSSVATASRRSTRGSRRRTCTLPRHALTIRSLHNDKARARAPSFSTPSGRRNTPSPRHRDDARRQQAPRDHELFISASNSTKNDAASSESGSVVDRKDGASLEGA